MTIQAWRLGSVGQDSVANTKGIVANGTDNQYMTLETPVGTDYQVTAGYTFYMTKIYVKAGAAAAGLHFIGYGDDGVAAGAAQPTNPVVLSGGFSVQDANKTWEWDVLIPIPAGKYPYVKCRGTLDSTTIYGVEVAN